MTISREQVTLARDKKVLAAFENLAPIWLTNEVFRPYEESLLFNLIYTNPEYGWISERFKYDGFNDVLYHMGTRVLRENEVLPIQEQEPYIAGEVAYRVP